MPHPKVFAHKANSFITTNPAQSGGDEFSQMYSLVAGAFKSEVGLLLLFALVLVALTPLLGGNSSQLAHAKFGGRWAKLSAIRIGQQQLKERKHNRVTLYAGSFSSLGLGAKLSTILTDSPPTLIIPNAQQGIIGFGAPNSGKTFSLSDPCIRSAIEQEYPIVVLETKLGQKGNQLEAHAAYAAAMGYQVHVFAPGYPFSGVINPLDFVQDEEDSLMARQLANVINLNSRKSANSKQDEFFSSAGDQLVEAILLLAKSTAYPDLMMGKQLLALSDLPTRLRFAKEQGKINAWNADSFGQFLASEAAAPTSGGISATASRTFDTFIKKQLVSTFINKSTIPLELKGKQILFLGVDTEKETVVLPILASILHLLITHNFSQPRTEPFILSLDEFPVICLPDIKKWLNKLRSMGLVAMLFCQNQAQIRSMYGIDEADEIIAACGTKAFFNPRHYPTAKTISDYLGDKEVCMNQFSRTRGKGGGSTTYSKHYHIRPLKSASEILLMDEGEVIFINPANKEGRLASIPLHLKVRIPKRDVLLQKQSEDLWRSLLCPRLIKNLAEFHMDSDALRQALSDRRKTAELLLPLPEDNKGSKAGIAPLQGYKEEYYELFRS